MFEAVLNKEEKRGNQGNRTPLKWRDPLPVVRNQSFENSANFKSRGRRVVRLILCPERKNGFQGNWGSVTDTYTGLLGDPV